MSVAAKDRASDRVASVAAKDLSVADASRLAQKLRLAAVHFNGVSARTSGGTDGGPLGWALQPIDVVWGIAENQVRVVLPVSLEIFRDDDGKRGAAVAEIGVVLRLDYDVGESGEPDAAIASFVGISGCMHAWPYIRAEVQHLSTKLELPPFLLPSLVSGNVSNVVNTVRILKEPTTTTRAKASRSAKPKRRARKSGR